MKRCGLALLPALWLVILLGGFVLQQAAKSATALRAAHNRVLLTAAEWARNACLSHVREQAAVIHFDSSTEHASRAQRLRRSGLNVARTDLGNGVSCEARFMDLGTIVNINTADSALLSCIIRDQKAVAEVLARRPFPNEDAIELTAHSERTDSTSLDLLAVRGPNRFNINSAPAPLLDCLEEVGPHGAIVIALRRSHQREFTSVAEFIDQLPPLLQHDLHRAGGAGLERLTVIPPMGAIIIDGFAGDPPVRSTLFVAVRLRGTDVDILSVEDQ